MPLTIYVLSQSGECISLEHRCLGWHKLWLSSRDITCPTEKAESHPCASRELERIKSKTITMKTPLLLKFLGLYGLFFFFWIQKKETVLNEWRDSSLALDSHLVTIAGEGAESTRRHSDSWALDKHQDNDSPSCHVGFLHLLGLAWICGRVMDESSGCTY